MRVRTARRDDLEAIVRVLADDEHGRTREDVREPLPAAYAEAFEQIEADPNAQIVVVEIDGAVVGCLQLTFIQGLSHRGALKAEIGAVFVAGTHRNRGVGRALVERALDLARERGCRLAQLTSDAGRTDAHRFYVRLGFVASHIGMKLRL